MDDEYSISADLCEEHGLVEPARVLRAIAGRACEVFMVRPDDLSVELGEMTGIMVEATARPRPLFLTREAAERQAARLKAAYLRDYPYQSWDRGTIFAVPEAEFCRRVGTILGSDYHLPEELPAPLVPVWANDEQLAEVAPLVTYEFFQVIRVPILPNEGVVDG